MTPSVGRQTLYDEAESRVVPELSRVRCCNGWVTLMAAVSTVAPTRGNRQHGYGIGFAPCCATSERTSWIAAAEFATANSAARNAVSAAANRCTSSATRRVRDSVTRHRPEQQRAASRFALNTDPHTTHS